MRTMTFIAAVAVALSTAAMPGSDGPYTSNHWTNGQYAQQLSGPVNIFPNPASQQVNVVYPGLMGEATLTIVAEDGRIMRSMHIGQTNGTRSVIDLNNLANGVYLVRVEQPSGLNISRRLIVSSAAQSVSP
ncbi:MAG: T9SS type A sorting domain-containing protein [Flavobacteriales bacterium]|nr:T9SS type A sorting domain-containing protein [Flavobacteriales bacterium]MCB0758023.1 T9SS type A sorting domain-containing protein [Flavobacteriales bacterium]